jgi:hypothetical protein
MGRSNVWYASRAINVPFKQSVLDFVTTGRVPSKQPPPRKEKPRQTDPYKRQRVEKSAIKLTTEYYESLGYAVDSVEKDNIGWDLEAILHGRLLRLEVKGLSQKELLIELTPNEYEKMRKYQDSYRICVVIDALDSEPLLRIFSFSSESGQWEDIKGNQLTITEITSARMAMT